MVNQYVVIGSYNEDKAKPGIYLYSLNSDSGKLTEIKRLVGIRNPSYLDFSPNGKFIYACTESKTKNNGRIASFSFNDQEITYLNSQPSGGDNPVHLSIHPSGNWLINANYSGGSISVYPLNSKGEIGEAVQNFKFENSSIARDQSHMHSAVFSPDGKYAYFQDLGGDKIIIYNFNASATKPLSPFRVPHISTIAGGGPRHLIFHPVFPCVYVIEEISGSVIMFEYNKGELKEKQRVYTRLEAKTDLEVSSADLRFSPDGNFLYASNRGEENNIAIFKILKNGYLKLINIQDVFGNHPRSIALDASGNFLIATNQISNKVTVFKRDQISGLLTKVNQELSIESPSVVKIRNF